MCLSTLSQASGFMRIEDITYLKRNISELPVWEKNNKNELLPLSNLFVVASQAHNVNSGNREQLKGILDTGCSNLLKTLSDGYWYNRQNASGYAGKDYGRNKLRSRFFTYTTDILDLCTKFNKALKTVLETLPLVINDRAKAFVADYIKKRKPTLAGEIEKYEGIVAERDKYNALLKAIDSNELARIQDNDKRKKEVRDEIHKLSLESINEFSDYCSCTVNTDKLVSLIKERKVKNKKDEVEQFGSWLQSTLQEQYESVLVNKAEILKVKTESYIKAFSESVVAYSFESTSVKVDFDAGWAFASALSKVGLIGGLAGLLVGTGLWVGTLLFSAPLIMMGLGPIGIALGILMAGVLGTIKLFGGGWEKSVAKKNCLNI
jgi:hypothetical protein